MFSFGDSVATTGVIDPRDVYEIELQPGHGYEGQLVISKIIRPEVEESV